MTDSQITYQFISEHSKVPHRQTVGAAGHDLYSSENVIISLRTRRLVSTGIKTRLNRNTYAQIAPRSGLAVKGIDIGAGIIDSDYEGEIKILLINNSDKDFEVKIGDRIAQLIIHPVIYPEWVRVDDLGSQSSRGEGGFGSTGKN